MRRKRGDEAIEERKIEMSEPQLKDQPAFPVPPLGDVSTPDGFISHQFPGSPGMTYRQWLVGMAMQGYCANPEAYGVAAAKVASYSIDQADKVIEQMEETNANVQ
jgi:hypothetical protein